MREPGPSVWLFVIMGILALAAWSVLDPITDPPPTIKCQIDGFDE